ncbi:hypothetical protein QM806_39885 [Rhodococcus sp. IEGM 1351]|nr:hypothetical protein [Rhodococcus sp. IEGM 1351]
MQHRQRCTIPSHTRTADEESSASATANATTVTTAAETPTNA